MATLPNPIGYGAGPKSSGAIAQYRTPQMAGVGETLQRAGSEFERAAQIINETNRKQDELIATDAITKLKRAALDLEFNQDTGFANAKGSSVVGNGFVSGYQEKFSQTASQISAGLTSDYAKQYFKQHQELLDLQYQSALLRHQASETDAFNKQTRNDAVSVATQDMLAHPFDDDVKQTNMLVVGNAATEAGKEAGLTGDDLKKHVEAQVGAIQDRVRKAADGAAYENAALQLEQGGDPRKSPVWERMDDGHKAIILNRINSAEQQRQARAIAEQQRREHDAAKELDGLSDFAITGAPMSREYEDSVRAVAAAAGPQFSARADDLIRIAQQGVGFGAQPLNQQAAALGELERQTQSQAGSSPEILKRMNTLRAMHDRQKREYSENPWQAAQKFGRLGIQAPEADIKALEQVPSLISNRLQQISSVETMAGKPVSPLQPEEARQFTELLNAADPVLQSRALAKVSNGLSLGQVEALSGQIEKGNKAYGIALKLGSENTTAGRMVSELVLRGYRGVKDKLIKRDDAALTGWRASISELVEGALGSQEAEAEVIDAAYYVMAAQDLDSARAPGFTRGFGSGAKDAVSMVVGLPIERQGTKTLLPRGMQESQFDDALRQKAQEQAKILAPTGKLYMRGQELDFQTQVLPNLETYGLQRDPGGRYVPVGRGFMLTTDQAGTVPFAIKVQ